CAIITSPNISTLFPYTTLFRSYQYFFSKEYYPKTKDYDAGYGMKDKIFMKESAHYIEQLPQPFYAKLITVTNHYPYILDKQNKRSEEHTSELQSRFDLVCRLQL